jgi:hypothetical protein
MGGRGWARERKKLNKEKRKGFTYHVDDVLPPARR